MIINRFFKTTLGIQAEVLIAQSLDASGSGASAGAAGSGTYSATVAASPTAGDIVLIETGPHTYSYTVQAGDTTAALFGTALLAYLNAEAYSVANSITWTKAGTTSLVLTSTFSAADGAKWNGTITGIKAGATNAGPTFSGMSSTNVSGGYNATLAFQANYKLFVASAVAGSLAVFWDDTNLAVQPGETTLPANSARKIFYAWKQGDGLAMRTTGLPVLGMTKSSAAYNAGQAQISTITYTGTYTATQYLHVKVLDTTGGVIPYPNYEYTVKIGSGGINQAVTDLAALINAEATDPIVTATASTNVLTVTGAFKTRPFKLISFLETVVGATTDASTIVVANTQLTIQPVGLYNGDVAELEKYFLEQNGAILYSNDGTLVAEWQTQSTNVLSSITYGILLVTVDKSERGATRNYSNHAYVIIALPTASLVTLASI